MARLACWLAWLLHARWLSSTRRWKEETTTKLPASSNSHSANMRRIVFIVSILVWASSVDACRSKQDDERKPIHGTHVSPLLTHMKTQRVCDAGHRAS